MAEKQSLGNFGRDKSISVIENKYPGQNKKGPSLDMLKDVMFVKDRRGVQQMRAYILHFLLLPLYGMMLVWILSLVYLVRKNDQILSW